MSILVVFVLVSTQGEVIYAQKLHCELKAVSNAINTTINKQDDHIFM